MSNAGTDTHAGDGMVVIREAVDADAEAMTRLAGRDTAAPIDRPALVAQVGNELRAALSTSDGRAIADPFHPTAELVEMLRLRAQRRAAPVIASRPATAPTRLIPRLRGAV